MTSINYIEEDICWYESRENNYRFYEKELTLKEMFVMKKDNKKLLEEVINDRLKKSLVDNPDIASAAFEDAMQAIDRQNELDKDKKDRMVKVVEIGMAVVAAPLIEAACKKGFARMICEFEEDHIFTTMAGKSLSALFKFRK